jgi:hypothetical protein
MHVQGITWHAVVLEAEEFAATHQLLIETFGLQPAIDQDGWALSVAVKKSPLVAKSGSPVLAR